MRMSCNGCRVLRKGCTQDCSLRPCLQWIKSPESQANATVFLAKFYGRAGLMNLINASPEHHRPAIFKSLLYEACGRIIHPIYGSVGLLWSGNWDQCQEAVDAVLKGKEIMQIPSGDATAATHPIMPLKGCDIRHVTKDSNDLRRVRSRNRFKRSGGSSKGQGDSAAEFFTEPTQFTITGWGFDHQEEEHNGAPSHDWSMYSESRTEESEIGLELTLGFNPVLHPHLSMMEERKVIDIPDGDA
ncbi:hypothetical protein F0562_034039 [Nyssa sinensis]|uniref:LOB domain-containing protein n=1 Tax=Nyssa sinensis TaxID=561372 RepID=A0A5J5AH28_9ASTE|nr:hypothetical protein F0562_034039 [Nyssa sinensis]